MTMQEVLQALQKFWGSHGCNVLQPLNSEVGAGTANPSTLLRVLGPEPWNACYVEPSVRPDDSRYGENPNRLQTHTQFQVILKPEPGEAQELYLASLRAIGIDTEAHDVRFVEDNWASPALGAWGLGWEVWLDGMEITQFTYFQQAAGVTLDPVSVEITYGIERIMMAVQGVSHFKDIRYSDTLSYGDIWSQPEYEMSRYYLDDADLERTRDMFNLQEAEARDLLAKRLPIPAYLSVLKCSHLFNVLDARGAVSPTERAGSFAQMRELTRGAAELWLERRAELGFPLVRGTAVGADDEAAPFTAPPTTAAGLEMSDDWDRTAALLFEIGVEELPYRESAALGEQLARHLVSKLDKTRLGHSSPSVFSTPRRLAVLIPGVREHEGSSVREVRGPKTKFAYDDEGHPTAALRGFAAKNGLDPRDLEIQTDASGEGHLVARILDQGATAEHLLPALLVEAFADLQVSKNMRWHGSTTVFSRPVRWVLAVHGSRQLQVNIAGLQSGTTTRGLRSSEPTSLPVEDATEYETTLRDHGVIARPEVRKSMILEQSQSLAGSVQGHIDLEADGDLIDQIVHLVEYPVAVLGTFDPAHLALPHEVLLTVMAEHQRYLPVWSAEGELLPYFITVANGPCDEDVVRAGNESVIRARFTDAAFFLQHDMATSPDDWRTRLESLLFVAQLGTMKERADRIQKLSAALADEISADEETLRTVRRAGQLVRFDHLTGMVAEFSSLAGTMARYYALAAGEAPNVATALEESEWPKKAGGRLPATLAGSLLSIADRADLLAGLASLRVKSNSSSDQFGIRRAALGLAQVMSSHPELAALNLRTVLDFAVRQYPNSTTSAIDVSAIVELISGRLDQQLVDEGHDVRHVRASSPAAQFPHVYVKNIQYLHVNAEEPAVVSTASAILRAANLLGSSQANPISTPAPHNPWRSGLLQELDLLEKVGSSADGSSRALEQFIADASPMISALATFLDNVRVLDDDPEIRDHNLALLKRAVTIASAHADWNHL